MPAGCDSSVLLHLVVHALDRHLKYVALLVCWRTSNHRLYCDDAVFWSLLWLASRYFYSAPFRDGFVAIWRVGVDVLTDVDYERGMPGQQIAMHDYVGCDFDNQGASSLTSMPGRN